MDGCDGCVLCVVKGSQCRREREREREKVSHVSERERVSHVSERERERLILIVLFIETTRQRV